MEKVDTIEFQSTRSAWSVTITVPSCHLHRIISIHTLRMERDFADGTDGARLAISIHTLRMERDGPQKSSTFYRGKRTLFREPIFSYSKLPDFFLIKGSVNFRFAQDRIYLNGQFNSYVDIIISGFLPFQNTLHISKKSIINFYSIWQFQIPFINPIADFW